MPDKQCDKLINLFFYGVSFTQYDNTDASCDIITNIRRRFLLSLKPASNKLYRSAAENNYVYSYNFTSDRPLQWKVTKNRKVIEEIEQLLSGKYCINYYDDLGKDRKKVFFDPKHRWLKSNYYNSVSNENLSCTLVPKEFEDGTSILKYVTGVVYPERLYSCTVPSCDEVRKRVLNKIPVPVVSALTDRGVVYFLPEEEKNLYERVLSEEERCFESENAPEVYVSVEDAQLGFNLNPEDFDVSKNSSRSFDISLAKEFDDNAEAAESAVELKFVSEPQSEESTDSDLKASDDGSVNAAITDMVEKINELTDLSISVDEILGDSFELNLTEDGESNAGGGEGAVASRLKHIDSVLDGTAVQETDKVLVIGESVVDDDYISSIIDEIISSAFDVPTQESKMAQVAVADTAVEKSTGGQREDFDENGDFSPQQAGDEAIDDDALKGVGDDVRHSLLNEEALKVVTAKSDEDEVQEESVEPCLNQENVTVIASAETYVKENPADLEIVSRSESYFYYGDTDEQGKRSGRGRTLMLDGSIAYEGEYKNDKRDGQGSFYFKDGSLCYWGGWEENLRCGFGVGISSEDKAIHTGGWKDNKPQGLGARFDSDGNLMFISSCCEDKKKGITISDLSDTSFTVRVWSEADDAFIQREFSVNDIV